MESFIGKFLNRFSKNHQKLNKELIFNDTNMTKTSPPYLNKVFELNCASCHGKYIKRNSKYGTFYGCSNYPHCKSTMKEFDYFIEFLLKEGINIYVWERICYKCNCKTNVYSYFLNHQLLELENYFICSENIGLGSINYLDKLLMADIETVNIAYSKTYNEKYIANTCEHCGAIQGEYYVVDEPSEIHFDLEDVNGMLKYFYKSIILTDVNEIEKLRIALKNFFR